MSKFKIKYKKTIVREEYVHALTLEGAKQIIDLGEQDWTRDIVTLNEVSFEVLSEQEVK